MQKIWITLALLLSMSSPAWSQTVKVSSEVTSDSVAKVSSRSEFDVIGRTYHAGTPYALPHAMFVIDRRAGNKIFYVNSKKFRFHKDFLYATGLAPLGTDIYKSAYFDEDRRFIVGTIAWQKPVDKWTWELWEGDRASAAHIAIADAAIQASFFERVFFKPNSTRHQEEVLRLSLPIVTEDEIGKGQEYIALNVGSAVGRVHIIDKLDDTVEIGDNEILILRELPASLPPVAGIIVARQSTPLSHVNILAKDWGIPNVYIKDADKLFRELDTKWIRFEATFTNYSYKFADKEILDSYTPPNIRRAPVDLSVRRLAGIASMRKSDSVAFGAKAANLGHLLNRNFADVSIPDGFSVPFFWYDRFMKENGFDKVIEEAIQDIDFVHNPRVRRKKLEELRGAIQKGRIDSALRDEIVRRWKSQLGGRPVFVRSSSNAEDLPNFSGAGLYSSVPNVRSGDQLIEAVKKVWASLWKFEAYEARVRNYVDQQTVYMSALIQIGVDMDRGGVMFSTNPFREKNSDSTYISVVCGHNDPITANGGMPEQIIVEGRSGSLSLMTFSQMENALRFDESGGLKKEPVSCASKKSGRIISDMEARRLASIALRVKRAFGGKVEQDIEWGMIGNRIFLLQARPYAGKK